MIGDEPGVSRRGIDRRQGRHRATVRRRLGAGSSPEREGTEVQPQSLEHLSLPLEPGLERPFAVAGGHQEGKRAGIEVVADFEDHADGTKASKCKFAGIGRVGLLDRAAAIIAEPKDGTGDVLAFRLGVNLSGETDRKAGLRVSRDRKSKTTDEQRNSHEEVDPTHRPPPPSFEPPLAPQIDGGIVTAGRKEATGDFGGSASDWEGPYADLEEGDSIEA